MSTQATRPVRDQKEREPVRRASLVAWICLLIVYVVWGSTYLAIRVGVETMPPLLMAAARSLVAGLIMFPLGLRRRRSAPLAPRWPSRAQWRACAAAGVLLLVGQGVVGVAERTIPSGLAALLIATVPLWLLGLDAGLNRARLGRAQLAGLLVGLAGVALLSSLGGGAGGRAQVSVVGVLIVLGAAGMWALGTMTARRRAFPSGAVLARARLPDRDRLDRGLLRLRHRGPLPAHPDRGHLRLRQPGDRRPARRAYPGRTADPGHDRRRRPGRWRRGASGTPEPARP